MIRETSEEEDREAGHGETAASAIQMGSDGGRARQGIRRAGRHLRPAAADAIALVVGAAESQFPEIDELAHPRVPLGRAGPGPRFPMATPARSRAGLALAAGLRAGWSHLPASVRRPIRRQARPSGMRLSEEMRDRSVTWGPVCPEPALRAWGDQVARRLRQRAGDARPDSELTRPTATKGSRSIGSPGGCGFRIRRTISRRWPRPSCGPP